MTAVEPRAVRLAKAGIQVSLDLERRSAAPPPDPSTPLRGRQVVPIVVAPFTTAGG